MEEEISKIKKIEINGKEKMINLFVFPLTVLIIIIVII